MKKISFYFSVLFFLIATLLLAGCSKDDEVRMPEDILGVWKLDGTDTYFQFGEENIVKKFTTEYQDGQSIGKWDWDDVYYYEPGYNLVIYLSSQHEADVYQILQLDNNRMVWCWVDEIRAQDVDSIGSIIGDIIKKAQEGFTLNPELYQRFTYIPELQFLELLDSLDIIYNNPMEY